MDDTAELLKQAAALGKAIAVHPFVRAYNDARASLEKDAKAQELLTDYTKHSEHVRRLEAEQNPIEVADKRKLVEYEHQMASNETLKAFMRSQADYVALMNQINRAMDAPLAAGRASENAS